MSSPYLFRPSALLADSVQIPIEYQTPESEKFARISEAYGRPESILLCPYCGLVPRLFQRHEWFSIDITSNEWQTEWGYWHALFICQHCTWISFYEHRDDYEDGWLVASHATRTISKHQLQSNTPIAEIRKHLARKWGDYKHISAKQAEDVVAEIFADHLDAQIHYVSNGVYSPDGGIDFVLVETKSGLEYAFQVKRRLTEKVERVHEVREFLGTLAGSRFNHGYYVTFAPKFSRALHDELNQRRGRLELRRLHLDVIDGAKMKELIAQKAKDPESAKALQSMSKVGAEVSGWVELPIGSRFVNERTVSDLTISGIAKLVGW
jgi:hypothetical protein